MGFIREKSHCFDKKTFMIYFLMNHVIKEILHGYIFFREIDFISISCL